MKPHMQKLKEISKIFFDFWNDINKNLTEFNDDELLNNDENSFRQAIELEDPKSSLFNRRAIVVFSSGLLLSLPVAALTPIIRVVDASGNIIPKGNIHIINNLEGGVVTKVHVENGQYVQKGDILVSLNPSLIKSDIKQRTAKTNSLRIQQKQLKEAIALNNNSDLLGNALNSDSDLENVQKKLLEVRVRNHKDQINVSKAVIKEKEVELTSLKKQLDLAIETENMWRSLTSNGAASKLKLLTAESQTEQIRGKRNEIEKALIQAKLNLTNLESDYELINTSNLANLESEEYVETSGLEGKEFELENMTIKANISGVISDLRFKNKGTVIIPGDQVVSIVPMKAIRQANIRIPAKDIGYIQIGQRVSINLLHLESLIMDH